MVEFAVNTFTQIVEHAMPFAIVFGIGDLIVQTFLRVAFGGKLWFGK